jgi:hypothetical protein
MSNINYWISRFLLTLCSFIFLSLASAQSVSYSLVTVSSPGNSADSITGFGSSITGWVSEIFWFLPYFIFSETTGD